jgi:glycosyltransferase involved in cell wall biosynthesis
MAVYNTAKYLHESIDSVLNQTFSDFEFIIINDGSNDKSLEIIKSYSDKRIELINQTSTGLAKALNNGINKSKCKIIARMDADDIAISDRFKIQYEFISRNTEYVIVGSNAEIIDINGRHIYNTSLPIRDKECKNKLPENPFIHPSIMFRKDAFNKAGQYSEKMLTGQDYVLINRMSKYGQFYNIETPLIKYRIVPHSNSQRSNNSNDNVRVKEIMDKAIDHNNISDVDYNFLKILVKNNNTQDNILNYHLLLAKKYLWNNYQPKLARINLSKSLKINSSFYIFALYLVSYLPSKMIYLSHKFIRIFKSRV